ncbi:hypothetical protein ACXR2U_21980 [Jatrophihabitans sp. YIM 134969]
MARALLGHLPTAADPLLLAEIARLRRRVADLEAQVAELRSHLTDVDSVELHAELHAMTQEHQAEPV